MRDIEVSRTGYIKTAHENIFFYEEMFEFTFMREERERVSLNVENEFLYGNLHNGENIAISCNVPVTLYQTGELKAWSYIVSREVDIKKASYYNEIEFRGGTLNQLLIPRALELSNGENGSNYIIKDDKQIYDIDINGERCQIEIGSCASEYRGLYKSGIENSGIYFKIKFSKEQNLKSCYLHYQKIKTLMSWMMYRRNVGFEEIILYQGNENDYLNRSCMRVYINEFYTKTDKTVIFSINFHDLGQAIVALLKILYESTDKKRSYSFGFLPSDDKDVNNITSEKIRAICSGIECEMEFIEDIKPVENENLKKLIKTIKKYIKWHRKTEEKLDEKTYSLIAGSMSYWTISAAEKTYLLYERYEEALIKLYGNERELKREHIEEFIKFRNDVTHGSYRVLTISIAETAYVMSGLVYCCMLKRIGFDMEQIIEFCRMKLLR